MSTSLVIQGSVGEQTGTDDVGGTVGAAGGVGAKTGALVGEGPEAITVKLIV
jgi:hypothetical protein